MKAPMFRVQIVKQDDAPGQFWWRVVGKNGEKLGGSEPFVKRSHALNMAKRLFPTFPIEVL